MATDNCVTCPWCGDEVTDSPSMDINHDGRVDKMDCAACGKPVEVTAEITVTYEVRKPEGGTGE